MSVERSKPTNPSPCSVDEGCQPPLSNRQLAGERGGVSVDGMSGKDAGINQESAPRAGERQPAAQALSEAARAGGAVGVSRSSVEPQDSTTCGEPRGGTGANALPSDEGAGDGWDQLLSEWNRIITPEKIRKLQRTLRASGRRLPDEWHSESRMRENRTYGSMRGGGGKTRTDNYGRFNLGRTTPPTLLETAGRRLRYKHGAPTGASPSGCRALQDPCKERGKRSATLLLARAAAFLDVGGGRRRRGRFALRAHSKRFATLSASALT
jgi:hypothetical protein